MKILLLTQNNWEYRSVRVTHQPPVPQTQTDKVKPVYPPFNFVVVVVGGGGWGVGGWGGGGGVGGGVDINCLFIYHYALPTGDLLMQGVKLSAAIGMSWLNSCIIFRLQHHNWYKTDVGMPRNHQAP